MSIADLRHGPTIDVERWRSELPLQALCILASLAIYAVLVISIIGIVYVVLFAVFIFGAHAILVAHIRGSAVRLGPDQFPELYRRVEDLSRRMGLEEAPDAYLMQAGGALNAFATRFLGLNVIVLYSNLLEACGDNEAARDMIVAHELGHIRAGHTKLRWLLTPGMAVPFLGSAYSQAREYTCDRYGMAGAGDRAGALLGLTILAAGGRHAPAVNQQALARQGEDLNTGWLTIGSWLASHPPLSKRLAALEPALVTGVEHSLTGRLRALAIIGAFLVVFVGGGIWAALRIPRFARDVERQSVLQQQQQLYRLLPAETTMVGESLPVGRRP